MAKLVWGLKKQLAKNKNGENRRLKIGLAVCGIINLIQLGAILALLGVKLWQ